MIYKLLHKPTGLFYQPHKHRGSHLSKKGKIYQTATHGLSGAFRRREYYKDRECEYAKDSHYFYVYIAEDSQVHKATKDILQYEKSSYGQLRARTNLDDWEIFEIA